MEYRIGISGIFLGAGILLGVYAGYAGTGKEANSSSSAPVRVQVGYEAGAKETVNEKALSLHALSAVLMDADSGRILYAKDANVFRPMASTTKIMTCILALEYGNLSDICTVSDTAAAQPKVHMGAGKGAGFYMKDLLYSLMLESHNDTAVMIAEQIGGSVEGFAAMMNQKARDIGCKNTSFVTPNGLDATVTANDGTEVTHGTTAEDLARIMRYCVMESPMRQQFLEITRTANYSFTDVEGKRSYSCVNHNAFLTMMSGALSGKTGFTGGAGYSYVAALEDEGRTFVVALLGSGWPPHKTYKWADTRALFSYGEQQYHYRDVFEEPVLAPVLVAEGIPDIRFRNLEHPKNEQQVYVGLAMNLPEEEKHLKLLLKDGEQVEKRLEIPDSLDAPVDAGVVAGHVTYLLEGQVVRTYPLYTDRAVKRKNFTYAMQQIGYLFFLPE